MCSYIISSIPTDMEKRSLDVTLHSLHCVLNLLFAVISSHDQCDEQTRPDLSQADVTSFTVKMLYNEQGEFFKALKQLNEQEDTRGPADVKKMTKERLRFFIVIHFLSKKEENCDAK